MFSLRALLKLVTALCVLFALLRWLGLIGSLLLLMLVGVFALEALLIWLATRPFPPEGKSVEKQE